MMKTSAKYISVIAFAASTLALSGCASLTGNGVVKAPCSSPSAGMTDPCGNRLPINSLENIDAVLAEQIAAPERT